MNIEDINFVPFSADNQLKLKSSAEKLMGEYIGCGLDVKDLYIICHNASVVYFSAYIGGKRAFESPEAVMKNLGLKQIALLTKDCLFAEDSSNESGFNQNFQKEAECLKK